MRRYSYTPRRNGRQTRMSGVSGARVRSASILPFALPVVVVLTMIVAVVWFAGGSGASCQGTSCNKALALAPTPTALRAVASPTPRHTPAPGR